jgi:hypothetical protein
LALVVLVAGHAQSADEGAVVLRSRTATAAWTGEIAAGTTPSGVASTVQSWTGIPAHAALDTVPCDWVRCDVASVEVALPRGTWRKDPGGMIVQIRWPSMDLGWDLDLFVYDPDGALAGRSTMYAFSRGESVWIPKPRNGRWTVVVDPAFVVGQSVQPGVLERIRYEAFVAFERGLTVTRQELEYDEPVTRSFVAFGARKGSLLPDVVPTTPSDFHIESGFGVMHYYFFGDRGLRHQPSCYPTETANLTADEPAAGDPPLRCLRWTQGEYNLGEGPLELHVYPEKGDGTDVYQRIYSADGSVQQFGPMGSARYNRTHLHFHYQGWQEITLRQLKDDGSLGEVVRRGEDKGICMVDIENARFGQTALPNGPLTYAVPGSCDQPTHRDPADPTFPGALYLQMGISVGYADLYPWYLGDQYIEITGLEDGRYGLIVRQDVHGTLRELDRTNNTATGCVEIKGEHARDIPCSL